MSIRVTDSNGVLRQFWDDTVGVRAYTEWDASGALIPSTPEAPNPRPYTPEENARADAAASATVVTTNTADLVTKARTAETNNATYLAIVAPTAAQAIPQVGKLTKQVNALIKLAIGDLQATDGT